MKTSEFDYFLPSELIAQTPIELRDHSRLMVLNRRDGTINHKRFFNLSDYLRAGDILVFNDSRVIPARLKGRKVCSGGKVEILLLRRVDAGVWEALVTPGKRVSVGSKIEIMDGSTDSCRLGVQVLSEITSLGQDGIKLISFSDESQLSGLGEIPLPPYIHTPLSYPERYQTVYACDEGSVAAPTAGLHFTSELINGLEMRGINCLFVTLHVGLDTFRPVREENPIEHHVYREYGELSQEVADYLSRARAEGRRIICVGTTTVRILEQVAQESNSSNIHPFTGWVSLFILPGHRFRVVDGLITNFHLPRSTLLMLVTAFAGKDFINLAYQEAIASHYHFYSFGDAMLIL
ncbi:tRNA preQ1(34) S-adenosylmethionine ribosyltransferase-isomerase QueA [Chloroflexota bacterium]